MGALTAVKHPSVPGANVVILRCCNHPIKGAAEVLSRVFRFLEVDDLFLPDLSLRHNVGGIPQCALSRLPSLQDHLVLETLPPFRIILHWTTLQEGSAAPIG